MKLLLATDGSSHARHAELLASRIPSLARGDWTIATVVSPPIVPMMGIEPIGAPMISDDLQSMFDAQLESANRILDDAEARVQGRGTAATKKLLEGNASDELLALAHDGSFDIVVLGSRGLGGLEAFLLGGVAKAMVHRCAASVLIGRRHGESTIEDSIHRIESTAKMKVGVGADGSEGSDQGLAAVRECGTGSFESIALVAALPFSGIPTGLGVDDCAAAYAVEEAEANQLLHDRASTLSGIAEQISSLHATAEPNEALMSAAKQKDLDLLVVGSARQTFFDRVVLGSTAASLASHAPCSVWIVRPILA